jgi:arginase
MQRTSTQKTKSPITARNTTKKRQLSKKSTPTPIPTTTTTTTTQSIHTKTQSGFKQLTKNASHRSSSINTTKKTSYSFKATPQFDTVIDYQFVSTERNVSLVGVPFAFGQPLQGVDKAPQDLRANGLADRIKAEKWKLNDHGDISVPINVEHTHETRTTPDGTFNMKSGEIVSKVCQDTAEITSKHAAKGDFMLTLGGDHSIAMGSIAGILKARPNTGIIWVDAHADINTPLTTPSGNIHGMPVSFLMKHPHCQNIPQFDWLKDYPALNPNKIVYIGLRDLEDGEKRIIKQYGIKAFTMQDVDRHGIGAIMDKAVRHLTNDRRLDIPIHLSLDIDGVDPLFAPSTGTRVFGGLYYREAYFICEALAETGLLSSMDLVEVNTSLGGGSEAADRTVKIANGLIAAALGNRIL